MEYLVTNGKRQRAHKAYVGVVVRMNDEGRIDPLIVLWPDGRSFRIDEITSCHQSGPMHNGIKTVRYQVRFGNHETNLYLEYQQDKKEINERNTLRWWVYALDTTLPGSSG